MKRVLIQCGDVIENRFRVLALAERLKAWGIEPVVVVYTRVYASLFSAFGIATTCLYDWRPGTTAQARAVLARSGIDIGHDDLLFFELEKDRMVGRSRDQNAFLATALRALAAIDGIVRHHGIDGLVVWNGHTGAVANAMRAYKTIRGLPGGYIERGMIRHGLFFDPAGSNGASTAAAGPPALADHAWRDLLERHDDAVRCHFPDLDRATFDTHFRAGVRRHAKLALWRHEDLAPSLS